MKRFSCRVLLASFVFSVTLGFQGGESGIKIPGNIRGTKDRPTLGDTLWKGCSYDSIPLHGKVQIVDAFPDIKVQFVDAFPDIKVKWVNAFPNDCGKWQKVKAFPDFKIQVVDAFPDIKVQIVESFPGIVKKGKPPKD